MFRFTNLIIFELTRDCNLNCKYCLMHEKYKHKNEIIDFTLFQKIINRIAEQRLLNDLADQTLNLVFHGGEPTLVGKHNFIKFLDYTTKLFNSLNISYNLSVQTNGTLLDEEYIKIFRQYNVSIGMSYDGINEKNPLRYSNETKKKLEDTIKLSKSMNHKIDTLGVLSKNNHRNIVKDAILFYNKFGCHTKYSFLEDLKHPFYSKMELSGRQIYRYAYKPIIKYFIKTGVGLEYHAMNLLQQALSDLLCDRYPIRSRTGCHGLICGAAVSMIAIRPDGSMGYCDRYSKDFKENYIMHALDYDFLGLNQLKHAVRLAKIKHHLVVKQGCDSCRATNICENQCLAFYYSKFGEYGIQSSLVCDQYLPVYDFVKKNLIKIIRKRVGTKIKLCDDFIYDIKPYYRDLFKNKYNIDLKIIDRNLLDIQKIEEIKFV